MLAKRWQEHEDSEAAHKLVTSHLRLVTRIAMGYRGYGLPIGEVISEGNVGLMQAVKRFDPDKGFRLATYAMWWIRASIQEYILRSWSLVKMGTTAAQKKLFFNLRRMKGADQGAGGGRPAARPGQADRHQARRARGRSDLHEPPPAAATPRSTRRCARRTAESASGRTGWSTRRPDQEERLAETEELSTRKGYLAKRHGDLERSREAHLRGAAADGGAGDAGGPVGRVRRQPRAHPPDRGARVREGPGGRAEVGAQGRGRGAHAGA